MDNIELLKVIYKDLDMSKSSLNSLYKQIKQKDNKIKELVLRIERKTDKYLLIVKKELDKCDEKAKAETLFKEITAKIGMKKELVSDSSDVNIAEMIIKGLTLGKLDIEVYTKSDSVELEEETEKLSKEILKFYEDSIRETEEYL